MRFGGRYVLGVDALPRGAYAAVVVGRSLVATFAVRSPDGDHLPVGERIRRAVADAEAEHGAAPSEVRVVCVDDGTDGAELGDIEEWLADRYQARLLVLDLVAPIEGPAGGPVDGDEAGERPEDHGDALSLARACEAALW
ncbi:MAG: hypothetical protein AAF962_08700 [Actinomycetota bacterium]